jgi:hypothetical protein
MKRYLLAVGVALTVLVAPTATAQTPTQDSVTGSGGIIAPSFAFFEFELDARSGPSGEAPTGLVLIDPVQFAPFEGPVTCLAVSGNAATLNFVVVDLALVVTVTVIDSPTGDRIDVTAAGRSPDDCSRVPNRVGALVGSGDIVVTDVRPLPRTKDECINGGWRSYGIFKNQGDCVSFVASGGKNPPAGSGKP